MSVCTSCGLPLEAGFAPMMPIPAAGRPSPLVATGPNPYRQDTPEEAPAPVAEFSMPSLPTEAPPTYAHAQVSETEAPVVLFEAAAGVPQDPPGTALKLTFADPLPPLPPPAEPVASTGLSVSSEPVPQFEIAESAEPERVFVLDDEPQAVPATFATFAAEAIAPEAEVPAEIVPLIPAGGLSIAPPATHTPGWSDGPEAQAAQS